MKNPTSLDIGDLKRVARYLKGAPRCVQSFEFKGAGRAGKKLRIAGYVDSDHAGCAITRRSTIGLVVLLEGHVVKTKSLLQSTISLSSGESEYYALVLGAAEGLGLKALMADWGHDASVAVYSDSSAARGMASRRGLGRVRHVATRYLWIQEKLRRKEIHIGKVGTHDNHSDFLTKAVAADKLRKSLRDLGYRTFGAQEKSKGK